MRQSNLREHNLKGWVGKLRSRRWFDNRQGIRQRIVHNTTMCISRHPASFNSPESKISAFNGIARDGWRKRQIHRRQSLLHMELTRISVRIQASPVVETECGVARLLDLKNGRTLADGMDKSTGDEIALTHLGVKPDQKALK